MRQSMKKLWMLGGSAILAGCTATGYPGAQKTVEYPAVVQGSAPQHPRSQKLSQAVGKAVSDRQRVQGPKAAPTQTQPTSNVPAVASSKMLPSTLEHHTQTREQQIQSPTSIQAVSHQTLKSGSEVDAPNNTLSGSARRPKLGVEAGRPASTQQKLTSAPSDNNSETPEILQTGADPEKLVPLPAAPDENETEADTQYVNALPMHLATALAMVGGQNPEIGLARWRVQEAYAELEQAEVLWLPSIQAGFSYHRHDGNYQASDGDIVDVNRSSLQYGFGAGATGAGTTPIPGLVARFHMADAIFQPQIAQKTAWAQGHAANVVQNQQLLEVALAYLNLLEAEQDLAVLNQSKARTQELAKLTADFAATGQGLQADADRMATELTLVESRISEVRELSDIAASRLAQELSVDASRRIIPVEPSVIPITLVPLEHSKGSLISSGLAHRPELKEAQALVAAACDQYQRQKYSPFVPSVLLGLSDSGFGGGLGTEIDNVNNRVDFDAIVTWEIRNLCFGERAQRRAACAQIEQAKYEKIRLLDQVAQEVVEAYSQVVHRSERIEITRKAIPTAMDAFERDLGRIRDGQGLPIEVLQSIRALENAERSYLNSVIEYNSAQFQLQWALGWPVTAPSSAPTLQPVSAE
ncbi:Outer membrane efflux protein [Thalassoglobus neptunius]|uniref:Outer membrane efflux protein n=1 Tax=Thalassoglobus neptunius TaxID=1938619 RepID=A0A5C5X1H3_9PLAN|nr:TolC family protein [Thalassoglobus neptunius]TWT56650.1 Outer membrane efflux protein [Thalassoglobus neptunius]